MPRCVFVSDLHGRPTRYQQLFRHLERRPPDLLLLGGDLLPHGFYPYAGGTDDFLRDTFQAGFRHLRDKLGTKYPGVFLILGNDDGRACEELIRQLGADGLWRYIHGEVVRVPGLALIGYNYVPPTPFLLKDWERYDVSRFVDPGCVSPEEGRRSVLVDPDEVRRATISNDLEKLTAGIETADAVLLAHSPPYNSNLDRAALDGKMIDHAPLDVHVGSIAIRRWIESRQPLLGLHGHVHESTRITGRWLDTIGRTVVFNAAHTGPELALIEFDTEHLEAAELRLLD